MALKTVRRHGHERSLATVPGGLQRVEPQTGAQEMGGTTFQRNHCGCRGHHPVALDYSFPDGVTDCNQSDGVNMPQYAFEFRGVGFKPDGSTIQPREIETHNKQLEKEELEWLKTGPQRIFVYVKEIDHGRALITTWLGTVIGNAMLGPKREFPCFGPFPSIRRSVEVCIFGMWYHGWYFQSSGNYCRLKRAKRQKAR